MKTKFTNHPWSCNRSGLQIIGALVPENGKMSAYYPGICRLDLDSNGTYISMPFEEREANAKLIAAAPELYEALQAALHELQQFIPVTDVDVLNKVCNAMAKATGNQ